MQRDNISAETKTIGAAAEMWLHEGREYIRMVGRTWRLLLIRTPGTYVYQVRAKRIATGDTYMVRGWVIPFVGTWYEGKGGPICRGTIYRWKEELGAWVELPRSKAIRQEIMTTVWSALRYNHKKRLDTQG